MADYSNFFNHRLGVSAYGQGYQNNGSPGTYPIGVLDTESGLEGAFKRFVSQPTPSDLRTFGLLGLTAINPLINQLVTDEMLQFWLASASVEIEQKLSICISPIQKKQPFDFVVSNVIGPNWGGYNLSDYPVFEVTRVEIKFPHTQTDAPVLSFVLPAEWVSVSGRKVNIVPGYGALIPILNPVGIPVGGGMMTILGTDLYRPNMIEVSYTAGFANDRLPATVADLILTVAMIRMLPEILPFIFPYTQVSVGIDGVSQSATNMIAILVQARITMLQQKRRELESAIKNSFGNLLNLEFIGT